MTLEIVDGPVEAGAVRRQTFTSVGGTIGRSPDNHWILPHRHVSGHHARIAYRKGAFTIEDTESRNGVYVNGTKLNVGRAHPVAARDRIHIDPYDITVSIEKKIAPRVDDPFEVGPSTSPEFDDDPFRPVDPDSDPLLLGQKPQKRDVLGESDLRGKGPLSDHYTPPHVPSYARPETSDGEIPDDWDRVDNELTPSVSTRRPAATGPHVSLGKVRPEKPQPPDVPSSRSVRGAAQPHPPSATTVDLGAVLSGAGLDAGAVPPELARNFGEIIRVVVEGVMDVLQARQELKRKFRVEHTTFRPVGKNNPLKFSTTVEDALHNLLVKRSTGYLGPVESFRDAIDDVRYHELAMLAGIKAGFEAMLSAFDPARLQKQFDNAARGALLSAPAKLRYWDQYRASFDDMVRDSDASFSKLFGEAFAAAYEAQLERLKARGRDAMDDPERI